MRLESVGSKRLALFIPGMVVIMLSLLVLASGGAKAQATGDWSSNGSGEGFVLDCWASTFHYDVEMTLNAGGGGSITTICRSVTDVQPGWEEAYNNVGISETQGVSWTSSGSSVTLTLGGEVTCEATITGNSMTGSGSYYDPGSGITYYYDIDLTREGGGGGGGGGGGDIDMGGLTVPAAGAAVGAAAIGVGASLAGTGPVSASWGPALVRPPPLPPPPPPLLNPSTTWNMPVPQVDSNNGPHLVPADAPVQPPPTPDPNSKSTYNCPYCGQLTLSPLSSGWRCTNALCPARRQSMTHGYTTHEYHHEAWR